MTVKELIELLNKFPQELEVVYEFCSDTCLLEANQIQIIEGCIPRADGYVQNRRPDKKAKRYLSFPGN